MQLRHDDALGAVDDERTVLRHQRDLTEVDLLLFDVANGLGAGLVIDVPHDQANNDLDRGGEGHATGAALVFVVLGTIQRVADELERGRLAKVLDREDALEDRLQTHVLTLVGRDVALQELVVGALLNVDEVGDLDDLLQLAEVLADPEVVLNDRWHRLSSGEVIGGGGVSRGRERRGGSASLKRRCPRSP